MLALGSCHVWMHHSWMPCHSRGERLLSSEIYGNRKTFFPSGKHGKVSERMIFTTVLQGHQSDQSQISCATPSNTAIISYHPTLFMLCSCFAHVGTYWKIVHSPHMQSHLLAAAEELCADSVLSLVHRVASCCIMLHWHRMLSCCYHHGCRCCRCFMPYFADFWTGFKRYFDSMSFILINKWTSELNISLIPTCLAFWATLLQFFWQNGDHIISSIKCVKTT